MRRAQIVEIERIVDPILDALWRRLPPSGRRASGYEDLRQEGICAAFAAMRRYRRRRGPFENFVRRRVKGAMQDYLRRIDVLSRQHRRAVREGRSCEVKTFSIHAETRTGESYGDVLEARQHEESRLAFGHLPEPIRGVAQMLSEGYGIYETRRLLGLEPEAYRASLEAIRAHYAQRAAHREDPPGRCAWCGRGLAPRNRAYCNGRCQRRSRAFRRAMKIRERWTRAGEGRVIQENPRARCVRRDNGSQARPWSSRGRGSVACP